MGKRSSFPRNKHDFYATPFAPVAELVRGPLAPGLTFIDPCVGAGDIVDHLRTLGRICLGALDLVPKRADVVCRDSLSLSPEDAPEGVSFITNPAWTRQLLLPLIDHLAALALTWCLLPLDIQANLYFARYLTPGAYRLHKVQPVARVKWIDGSKYTAKDNACWYLFGHRMGPHVDERLDEEDRRLRRRRRRRREPAARGDGVGSQATRGMRRPGPPAQRQPRRRRPHPDAGVANQRRPTSRGTDPWWADKQWRAP